MTIVEIWKEFTEEQRRQIMSRIIADGLSASAIYAYMRGESKPLKLYREAIAKHIKEVAKWDVTVETLWPEAS